MHFEPLGARSYSWRRSAVDERPGPSSLPHSTTYARVTRCVWRLDRLARSLHQLIETVEALEARGIALKSLTEAIDTGTPGGRLVFHIFGSIAEFERAIIRERTMAGVVAAKARGRSGGRPAKLIGERAEHARNLLAAGTSVSAVARSMGVSRASVHRALERAGGAAE